MKDKYKRLFVYLVLGTISISVIELVICSIPLSAYFSTSSLHISLYEALGIITSIHVLLGLVTLFVLFIDSLARHPRKWGFKK